MKKEMETLMQSLRIYSQDIGMEFGTEKYAGNNKLRKEYNYQINNNWECSEK